MGPGRVSVYGGRPMAKKNIEKDGLGTSKKCKVRVKERPFILKQLAYKRKEGEKNLTNQ